MVGVIAGIIVALFVPLFVLGSCSIRSLEVQSTKIVVGLDHISSYPSLGESDVIVCILN